jgi:beta-mannosidase
MTEYGFQSFPELKTVEAFTIPEDRTSILTPVMLAHQKNTSGNAKIREYMLRDCPNRKTSSRSCMPVRFSRRKG